MIATALTDLWYGFGVALQPHNLMWCFIGVLVGNMVGVLAGHGPARDHFDSAAADIRDQTGGCDPDARRCDVRRAIRRRDLFDPAQFAVSSTARGDVSRRLPDDQAGQGRGCARADRDGVIRRCLLGHHGNDFPVADPGARCTAIRSGGNLFADAARSAGRLDAGARLADQGRCDDGAGFDARHRRHRSGDRRRALHVRNDPSRRRHRAGRACAWPVRHRRVHEQRQPGVADQYDVYERHACATCVRAKPT